MTRKIKLKKRRTRRRMKGGENEFSKSIDVFEKNVGMTNKMSLTFAFQNHSYDGLFPYMFGILFFVTSFNTDSDTKKKLEYETKLKNLITNYNKFKEVLNNKEQVNYHEIAYEMMIGCIRELIVCLEDINNYIRNLNNPKRPVLIRNIDSYIVNMNKFCPKHNDLDPKKFHEIFKQVFYK